MFLGMLQVCDVIFLHTMYLASASMVEMPNQLLRIVGSIIHLFCGIMRLVTCPISSIQSGLLSIGWYASYLMSLSHFVVYFYGAHMSAIRGELSQCKVMFYLKLVKSVKWYILKHVVIISWCVWLLHLTT